MLIDYVKVYKLKNDCSGYINSVNYDFSDYDYKVKNFIKIGYNNGNNSLDVGQDVKLRASQFIEISGNFSVPLGASLYLDANGECTTEVEQHCTQTFNPCIYDFSNYDNFIKKTIEIGGDNCNLTIIPINSNLSFYATDLIHLKQNVSIKPLPGKSVELKIVSCE